MSTPPARRGPSPPAAAIRSPRCRRAAPDRRPRTGARDRRLDEREEATRWASPRATRGLQLGLDPVALPASTSRARLAVGDLRERPHQAENVLVGFARAHVEDQRPVSESEARSRTAAVGGRRRNSAARWPSSVTSMRSRRDPQMGRDVTGSRLRDGDQAVGATRDRGHDGPPQARRVIDRRPGHPGGVGDRDHVGRPRAQRRGQRHAVQQVRSLGGEGAEHGQLRERLQAGSAEDGVATRLTSPAHGLRARCARPAGEQ